MTFSSSSKTTPDTTPDLTPVDTKITISVESTLTSTNSNQYFSELGRELKNAGLNDLHKFIENPGPMLKKMAPLGHAHSNALHDVLYQSAGDYYEIFDVDDPYNSLFTIMMLSEYVVQLDIAKSRAKNIIDNCFALSSRSRSLDVYNGFDYNEQRRTAKIVSRNKLARDACLKLLRLARSLARYNPEYEPKFIVAIKEALPIDMYLNCPLSETKLRPLILEVCKCIAVSTRDI